MTAKIDLDAIRERCEQATPGPWQSDDVFTRDESRVALPDVNGVPQDSVAYTQYDVDGDVIHSPIHAERNAKFIAHARADVPAMEAALREAKAILRNAACDDSPATPDAIDWLSRWFGGEDG